MHVLIQNYDSKLFFQRFFEWHTLTVASCRIVKDIIALQLGICIAFIKKKIKKIHARPHNWTHTNTLIPLSPIRLPGAERRSVHWRASNCQTFWRKTTASGPSHSGPTYIRQRRAHVSLLVIINHPHVILTSWTNNLMEYVSGQPPAFHLWIPGHCLPARKRASQEALQPIKNVLKHEIYNAAHIPTELQFHFTSWALAGQQSL